MAFKPYRETLPAGGRRVRLCNLGALVHVRKVCDNLAARRKAVPLAIINEKLNLLKKLTIILALL